MGKNEYDHDSFWDLKKLVPPKKTVIKPFSTRSQVTDYYVKGDAAPSKDTALSYDKDQLHTVREEYSYIPDGLPFIKKVTILRLADKYDFYGSFRKSAELYFDCGFEKCDFVPYYSYMPQYSQLTEEQRHYYFYWRDEVRHGRFIKSDYSYIYLFVYEILNLPDKIPPEEGITLLCRIWRAYRGSLPRIDSYFSVWVQDYCLVHSLRCPMELIGDFIFGIIEASNFKEFYLSDIKDGRDDGIDSLVAYLSDYDWRRGRYVDGAHAELYKKHMRGALKQVLDASVGHPYNDDIRATVSRDAFPHSLCTHSVKCRLIIEYAPASRDAVLRNTVTECVRYVENKLRALIGIKSRLAVKNLGEEYKEIIDGYFDRLILNAKKRRQAENVPDYEIQYDSLKDDISIEGADEIERESWSTTMRLVADDEIFAVAEEKTEQKVNSGDFEEQDQRENSYGLSALDVDLVRCALDGAFVDNTAAERINEAFSDNFGDVIFEPTDGGYTIIDDYREEVSEWILKMK